MTTSDSAALYHALITRDSRFDGIFFVGVTSTGIYCRPVCPAKKPKATNCLFFSTAEAAEKSSFRPCLRCRPELAPGVAPVDDSRRIADQIARRIEEGMLESKIGIEQIADEFELSSRQIRRIILKEFGVSPIELVLIRRLLLARQLLCGTTLPMHQVARASGFSSTRRFNDAFIQRNGIPPTHLRKSARDTDLHPPDGSPLHLHLAYRPPFDWTSLLRFLAGRALTQVELIRDDKYYRTLSIHGHSGWVCVSHLPQRHMLCAEVSASLTPVLPTLMRKLKHAFDLNARPDIIAAHLMQAPQLAGNLAAHPGLRVPGTFDGFEMAVRAILGQQITVKAATTISCRFASRFGEPIETPFPELTRLSPTAQRISSATIDDIASLGIIQTRTRSIIALAREVESSRIKLEPGADPDEAIRRLTAVPGIGQWTAHYIVMRALQWPDAFPKEDIVLRKALGTVSAAEAERLSQPWRPWRSYATMHLWQGHLNTGSSPTDL